MDGNLLGGFIMAAAAVFAALLGFVLYCVFGLDCLGPPKQDSSLEDSPAPPRPATAGLDGQGNPIGPDISEPNIDA
jgi:hypothetical protein